MSFSVFDDTVHAIPNIFKQFTYSQDISKFLAHAFFLQSKWVPDLFGPQSEAWNEFSLSAEFDRQNLHPLTLKRSSWNYNFKMTPSYPELLIFPTKVTDEQLIESMQFRTEGRLPGNIITSVDLLLQQNRQQSLALLPNEKRVLLQP